jgi:hypothetical protein
MSATIINLIIQLIAGALGGNAAGATIKNLDLGTLGNTIAGALGGAGGGTALTALLSMLQNAGNIDVATILGQAVGGGVANGRTAGEVNEDHRIASRLKFARRCSPLVGAPTNATTTRVWRRPRFRDTVASKRPKQSEFRTWRAPWKGL